MDRFGEGIGIGGNRIGCVGLALLGILLLILFLCGTARVDAGEACAVTRFGAVTREEGPGLEEDLEEIGSRLSDVEDGFGGLPAIFKEIGARLERLENRLDATQGLSRTLEETRVQEQRQGIRAPGTDARQRGGGFAHTRIC